MIRIGIVGGIGSGKSYIAKNFGYPVFNADNEVNKIYKSNKPNKTIWRIRILHKEIRNYLYVNKRGT